MKSKLLILLFLMPFLGVYSQKLSDSKCYQKIGGVSKEWHRLVLTQDVLNNSNDDFSNIRLWGVTKGDTIEMPYVLKCHKAVVWQEQRETVLLRKSKKEVRQENADNKGQLDKVFGFWVQNRSQKEVNELSFDCSVRDLILNESIKVYSGKTKTDIDTLHFYGEENNGQYTLHFSSVKNPYFWIQLTHDTTIVLNAPKLIRNDTIEGLYRRYTIKDIKSIKCVENNDVVYSIKLAYKVPVCRFVLHVKKDGFKYLRPIYWETYQGSRKKIYHSFLSLDRYAYMCNSEFTDSLSIGIINEDNRPLHVDSISVWGYEYELYARFYPASKYYIAYGEGLTAKPNYDIGYFADEIPSDLSEVTVGNVVKNVEEEKVKASEEAWTPDEVWLWVVVCVAVALLLFCAFRLLKET